MEECVRYFRERPVFFKVFTELRKKYETLGHLGGKLHLERLTKEEKEQLSGFFQKDFTNQDPVMISYAWMEKVLADSRFAGLSWLAILTVYFGEDLETNRQRREETQKEKDEFFQRLLSFCQTEKEREWICSLREGKLSSELFRQYREDATGCQETIRMVLSAGRNLPVYENVMESMPVFAARITGNPHYFDAGNPAEKLLLTYLVSVFGKGNTFFPRTAEQKTECLYTAGLLKDSLSNAVLTYGLHGRQKDGKLHAGLEGYALGREPLHLTLLTIGNLQAAWADTERIYMVENPAVFLWLCRKYPTGAFLCGNGQIRLAVWRLMDLIMQHNLVCYAGDFDPEGLCIAQNLKNRYGKKLAFWNYKREYYERYLSNVFLSESRLKKLDAVTDPELQNVKKAILQEKKAAYQEAMLDIFDENNNDGGILHTNGSFR
jgi:uncharacterized protein (TIGR02679 family)